MAATRLPPGVLSFKQFIHRQNVLSLYRKILKVIYQIPNEGDKQYLKNWARQEFKQNKNTTDEVILPLPKENRQEAARQSSNKINLPVTDLMLCPTSDQDTIRMMLTHGNLQLQELEKMLRLAK